MNQRSLPIFSFHSGVHGCSWESGKAQSGSAKDVTDAFPGATFATLPLSRRADHSPLEGKRTLWT
jgi:hypothetical protein